MLILDAAIKTPYRILGIDLPKNNLRHLSHLGMTPGETLEIVTKTKDSAILIIKGSRLAFDASILEKIEIAPLEQEHACFPLSELAVGESAIVVDIFAINEAKRRLMDMGITRGVDLHVRKVAPLGDPMELNVRGYELSVRKADAEMIEVE